MAMSWLPVDLRLKTGLECRLIIGHIALSQAIKWKFRLNRNSKKPPAYAGGLFYIPTHEALSYVSMPREDSLMPSEPNFRRHFRLFPAVAANIDGFLQTRNAVDFQVRKLFGVARHIGFGDDGAFEAEFFRFFEPLLSARDGADFAA